MSTIQSVDQLGNTIELKFPPQRIVSLVPSQTEFLFDLGLKQEIAGVTRFCIHPETEVVAKQKIGGTKRFDFETIELLQPDLIIGNKEENYLEGIARLRKKFPVWMSDIYTLPDVSVMMHEVARITNRAEAGRNIVLEIETLFAGLPEVSNPQATCAYFIWRKPYMVAAGETFINHMLGVFGLKNVFDNERRYPEVQASLLGELKPDFIFLSSEPYSFSPQHFEEFQSFSPISKIILVDGEMFSWYGTRLRHTAQYFLNLRKELGIV